MPLFVPPQHDIECPHCGGPINATALLAAAKRGKKTYLDAGDIPAAASVDAADALPTASVDAAGALPTASVDAADASAAASVDAADASPASSPADFGLVLVAVLETPLAPCQRPL